MIEWTEFEPAHPNDKHEPHREKTKFWHGKVGRMEQAVTIQGPTKHNSAYRVLMHARWKDAMFHDCASLDEAKSLGQAMVTSWLDACGLMVRPDL